MATSDNVPKPIRIALEMGFVLPDIKHCYSDGMNSATLVDRLCDYESKHECSTMEDFVLETNVYCV